MTMATLLAWTLLAQTGGGFSGPSGFNHPFLNPATLVGGKLDPTEAERQAETIVTGRPTTFGIPMLQGSVLMSSCDIKFAETLKGRAPGDLPSRYGLVASNGVVLPEVGNDYIFFLARQQDADVVLKVLSVTPANLAAVRRVIAAAKARALPNSQLPTREAQANSHTIVVAESTGGGEMGVGAAGIGWCDLKVASALKGDARTVDGKRVGYTAYGGSKPPTIGRPYLFFIGKNHDLDTILKVMPADEWQITAIVRNEADRRAIEAGAARSIPGENLTIAQAEARSPSIVIGEVKNYAAIGAGGFGSACCIFKVTSTLKGQAQPGEQLDAGYRPPDRGISPRIGESFVVFIGKIGKAGDRDVDGVLKLLPASATTIQAVRDQIMAPGAPVAAR